MAYEDSLKSPSASSFPALFQVQSRLARWVIGSVEKCSVNDEVPEVRRIGVWPLGDGSKERRSDCFRLCGDGVLTNRFSFRETLAEQVYHRVKLFYRCLWQRVNRSELAVRKCNPKILSVRASIQTPGVTLPRYMDTFEEGLAIGIQPSQDRQKSVYTGKLRARLI